MNDLISRQAAIDALRNAENHAFNSYYKGLVKAHKIIANLPPVIPQPKTGHWIMTSDYYTGAYGTIDYVKCSCCGKDSLEEGNFCPNCGAKMVEPKESDVV